MVSGYTIADWKRTRSTDQLVIRAHLLPYQNENCDGFLMDFLSTKTRASSCTCEKHSIKIIYEKGFEESCRMDLSMTTPSHSNQPIIESLQTEVRILL